MSLQQIEPRLLTLLQKKGELLVIWRCERCYKIIPFYKQNHFIDNIILAWAHDHRFCNRCLNPIKKKVNPDNRVYRLLEKYEFYEMEEDY